MSPGQKVGIGGSALAVVAIIVASIFPKEGGYSNNPKDPGGATNHGITEQVARKDGYQGDMRNLPKSRAEKIYEKNYIDKPNFDDLIPLSPAVAHKLVDAGVNVGPGRATRWLQEALNSVNRGGVDYSTIKVDGSVGPGTVRAYQGLQKARGRVQACRIIIKLVDAQQAVHYMSLKDLYTFTPGWVINRVGNIDLDKCELTPENYK